MNQLFYEARESFQPRYYMVMMQVDNHWQPATFYPTSGRFALGEINDNPNMQGDAVEIYDHETAMALLAHHALNGSGCSGCDMRLVKVFVPPILSGKSQSPFLNPAAPLDALIEEIKAAAAFSKEQNPDDDEDPWNLPGSLGGALVVSARDRLVEQL